MRYTDEHLAELLRTLPPAPERVVAALTALPAHLEEALRDEHDGESAESNDPNAEADVLPPLADGPGSTDFSDERDEESENDEQSGGDWG